MSAHLSEVASFAFTVELILVMALSQVWIVSRRYLLTAFLVVVSSTFLSTVGYLELWNSTLVTLDKWLFVSVLSLVWMTVNERREKAPVPRATTRQTVAAFVIFYVALFALTLIGGRIVGIYVVGR